jgi:shikimate kinase
MNRRFVILGFMGCGKTAVATELARQLKCKLIDLDSFITESQGRSPADIIEQDGEPAFRQIESLALTEVLKDHDARVIALGGGTWSIPANRTLIALYDYLTVWLDAPFEICWQRIIHSRKTARPLAPDQETAKVRYVARRDDYTLAQRQISVTEADSVESIASQVLA